LVLLSGSHKDFSPTNPWYDVAENDYVLGQFIWTGIDYLGESRGWPSKGWSTALVDTCGFVKAGAYFYQSVWMDELLVRICVQDDGLDIDPGKAHWGWPKTACHWNFADRVGHVVRVQTVTNCQTVELLLNNKSYAVRKSAEYANSTIVWHVPYEAGVIRAIGRDGGRIVDAHELKTAGAPARVAILPDRQTIAADCQDVVHLEIALLDSSGVLVPDSDRLIHFKVEGPGRLIGVDSGDLRNHEPYQSNARTTYWGRALAIVQSTSRAGEIRVTAQAEGIEGDTVVVQSE